MNRQKISYMLPLLLLATTLQAAEVSELSGTTHTGDLISLDEQTVILDQNGTPLEIPVAQLLQITWGRNSAEEKTGNQSLLTLADGSALQGEIQDCDGLQVRMTSAVMGGLSIPLPRVKAIRFAPLDTTSASQWQELMLKTGTDDKLVIKKGDVLDFLPGVVTEYNEKEVIFLYQGSEIPVKREKVFGIIHPRSTLATDRTYCRLTTTAGDQIALERVTLEEGKVLAGLDATQTLTLPVSAVKNLDFSLGRIVSLSDLNPEGVEHTPYFDTIWNFQRDKTNIAGPLQLGGKRYSKGLWIHSKTRLTYRLAGEYSRFQSMIGIDDAVAENGLGHVHLTITADDKILFDEEVTALEDPRLLDLNLTGVRFLQILVDFGSGLDIGDHLVLGDAKLIK